MSSKTKKWIHLIFGCILTVLLISLGIALMVSCLDIYNSGRKPYTPQSIAAHFQKISLMIYLTIGCIVLGFVLNLAIPQEKKKPKALRDNALTLERMQKKAGALEGDLAVAAAKEQNKRKIYRLCTGIACVMLSIRPLLHFMNQDNFLGNKTQCVIHAMTVALIYGAASLALTFLCKVLCSKSIDRQIDVYKSAIAGGAKASLEALDEPKKDKKIVIIRCVIAVVAVVFIILGIFNGGAQAVLDKANAICMECIGMG